MTIRELTNQEFSNFIHTYPNKSMYQTTEYAFVMNKENYESLFLGLVDDELHIQAASLILIEKSGNLKYATAPRGFLIDYRNFELLSIFTKEIKKFLSKRDVIAIKINPKIEKTTYDLQYGIIEENSYYPTILENLKKLDYYHFGYPPFFEGSKPRFEAILDLNKPDYLLFQNFAKPLRTKIRGAYRKGVKIYRGSQQELPYLFKETGSNYPRGLKYFEDCYTYFGKNKKIDFYYAKIDTATYLKLMQGYFQKQEQEVALVNKEVILHAKENSTKLINRKIYQENILHQYKNEMIRATKMLRDFPEGIVVASALIVKEKDCVYLLIDGFEKEYKSFNAKALLLWNLIQKYTKQGYQKFNLGGMTDPLRKENLYYGLNEYKLSFRPIVIEYIGELELVCNNALYFLHKNSKQWKQLSKRESDKKSLK